MPVEQHEPFCVCRGSVTQHRDLCPYVLLHAVIGVGDERFYLKELLHAGVYSAVYLAHPSRPDTGDRNSFDFSERVVLKIPRTDEYSNFHAVEAHRMEAYALAAVQGSEHVAKLRCLQELAEPPYLMLVLEYVAGAALSALLDVHLTSVEVAAIAAQALVALHVTHAAGYVHRDVNPRNLVLSGAAGRPSPSVRVVLIDFGIARRNVDNLALVSSIPAAVGSAGFIAPELELGGPLQPSADLFSLGMTLAALLGIEPQTEPEFANEPTRPVAILTEGAANAAIKSPGHRYAAYRARTDRVVAEAPDELRALLRSLCEPDPLDRLSTARDALRFLRRDFEDANLWADLLALLPRTTIGAINALTVEPPLAEPLPVPPPPDSPPPSSGRRVRERQNDDRLALPGYGVGGGARISARLGAVVAGMLAAVGVGGFAVGARSQTWTTQVLAVVPSGLRLNDMLHPFHRALHGRVAPTMACVQNVGRTWQSSSALDTFGAGADCRAPVSDHVAMLTRPVAPGACAILTVVPQTQGHNIDLRVAFVGADGETDDDPHDLAIVVLCNRALMPQRVEYFLRLASGSGSESVRAIVGRADLSSDELRGGTGNLNPSSTPTRSVFWLP